MTSARDCNPIEISVVIPTFNRRRTLARTIPTILEQSLASSRYEVLVVVDGSTDGTSDSLRTYESRYGLRLVEQLNQGQAAARNAGLALATGRLVLFLDDDLLCTFNLLEEHLRTHELGSSPALVFGPVGLSAASRPGLATSWIRADVALTMSRLSRSRPVDGLMDVTVYPNSSVDRRLIQECGGFDERFVGAGEDTELGLRLWKQGVDFCYAPGARTEQIFEKTAWTVLRKEAPEYGRNEVRLWRRHPEFRRRTVLSRLVEGPPLKRFVRKAVGRLPAAAGGLSAVSVVFAELLWRLPGAERVAVQIFRSSRGAAMLVAAVKEVGSWETVREQFERRLPVLVYHHVGASNEDDDRRFTITPARFEQHVRWLARAKYVGIRPKDWIAWRDHASPLPPRPILITFDDGYADVVKHALPILQRHGYPATLFVVSGKVGGSNEWEAPGLPRRSLSDAESLSDWLSAGMEIGGHTRTHADLRTLPPKDLAAEVGAGRVELEALTRSPVYAFAYPYSSYDQSVVDEVRKAFEIAFTVGDEINDIRTDSRCLSRLLVRADDSIFDLLWRVRFGRRPLERVRSRLRLRTRMRALHRA